MSGQKRRRAGNSSRGSRRRSPPHSTGRPTGATITLLALADEAIDGNAAFSVAFGPKRTSNRIYEYTPQAATTLCPAPALRVLCTEFFGSFSEKRSKPVLKNSERSLSTESDDRARSVRCEGPY